MREKTWGGCLEDQGKIAVRGNCKNLSGDSDDSEAELEGERSRDNGGARSGKCDDAHWENNDTYDLRPPYNNHFAWNHYLLSFFCEKVRREWVLPVIHGFFAQANISVLGRPIYVTLIARRLRHMAGN